MARQAVDHGVLDQRLQNQARHPHGRNFRRVGQLDIQAIGEAPLLQLQVQPCELQLIGQPREIALAGIEQPAQQIGELHHHGLRGFRIPFDVAANGMQQIEQGMRRQLHAQRRQAGGAPFALERGEPQFGIAKARVEREAGHQRQPEAVGRQETHETGEPERQTRKDRSRRS